MNGISLDQVKSAWQRHLQPDRLITVIVGGQPAASTSPGAPGA
jgi:zinc protease